MTRFSFRVWQKEYRRWEDITETRLKLLLDPEVHEHYVIMQSTGLLDSKGVEIFEGDVVKSKDWHHHGDFEECYPIGEVKWAEWDASFWLSGLNPDCPSSYGAPSISEHLKLEILGNVYENPELLKP